MIIRSENEADLAPIRSVLEAAFPTDAEARLVEAMRQSGNLRISLIAERDGRVVGHIGFSPVTASSCRSGLGLAPVAVLPDVQGTGIGGQLIRHGLAAATQLGAGYVVVLGEPVYYRRFGFLPASTWNLSDEYGGGAAFQAIELKPGAIPRPGGLVTYGHEFKLVAD